MDTETRDLLQTLLAELDYALDPLLRAVRMPRGLYGLLASLGWRLDGLIGDPGDEILSALEEVRGALANLAGSADGADAATSVAELVDAASIAWHAVRSRHEDLALQLLDGALPAADTEIQQALAADLLGHLLVRYLSDRQPDLLLLAASIGLLDTERGTALSAPDGTRLRFPVGRALPPLGGFKTLGSDPAAALLKRLLGSGDILDLDGLAERVRSWINNLLAAVQTRAANPHLRIDADRIALQGLDLGLSSVVQIPLPEPVDGLTLEFNVTSAALIWLPDASSGEPLPLFESGGFSLALNDPAAGSGAERGLTLERVDGTPTLTLAAGIEVGLPDALVAGARALGQGHLTFDLDGAARLALDHAELTLSGMRLGGTAGPSIDGRLVVEGLGFPLPDPPEFTLEIAGELNLGESTVSVLARLDGDGFLVTSSTSVDLGSGFTLEPIDTDTAVLNLRYTPATGHLVGMLNGRLSLGPIGSELSFLGELDAEVDGGGLRLLSLAAEATLGELRLPGELVLEQVSAALGYVAGEVTLSLNAALRLGDGMTIGDQIAGLLLAAQVEFDTADPLSVRVIGDLAAADIVLGEQARLFASDVHLNAETGPGGTAPSGSITLNGASGGLLHVEGDGSLPEHYRLALTGIEAGIVFDSGGFTLTWTSGTLQLPPAIFARDGGGIPSIELSGSDATEALSLRYQNTTLDLNLRGRLRFRDFGLALPGDSGLSARFAQALLILDGANPPRLDDLDGEIRLPLPGNDKALIIGIVDVAWDLEGLPTGALTLATDGGPIELGGGFTLGLLAADPTVVGGVSRLQVERHAGHWDFEFSGGLALGIPAELIAEASTPDATLILSGRSQFFFSTDPSLPSEVRELILGLSASNLRLGGESGLLVESADLALGGIETWIDPQATSPLILTFSGQVQAKAGADSITLGLEGAELSLPADGTPTFRFSGISAGTETPLFGGLVTLHEVAFGLVDDNRPLLPPPGIPALLAADNIEIGLTIDLTLDTGDGGVTFGAEDAVMRLDPNGLPQLDLDGFHIGIEDLNLGILSASGGLYLRGLSGANPPFLAGNLGGQYQGMGIELLCAVDLAEPPFPGLPPVPRLRGACLDVSLGTAGIQLYYGFTLNGVAGGISFLNSNESPCDFKAYLGLDDAGQDITPTDPAAPSSAETSRPGVGSARPLPYGDCPAPCPPASMNPLCQPHPDAAHYPNRPILRFSSLDPALLDAIGLLDAIDSWFPALDALDSTALADLLRSALADLLLAPDPPINVPGLAPDLQTILNDPLGHFAETFVGLLQSAAEAALQAIDPPTPRQLLTEIAHAGIPCPDVTLQVTGTFSYTGVSAFASVTGGVSVSSTGSIGVLGWLNVFNIPLGQLRAFLTLTDENGFPDPSLCGDLNLGFGPLEVGRVGFTEYFQGVDIQAYLTEGTAILPNLIAQAAANLPAQSVAEEIADVLRLETIPADPIALLPTLTLEQAAALVSRLGRRAALGLPDQDQVKDFLVQLLDSILHFYDPRAVFCGNVSPKLFGLPLAGDGLLAFRGWGSSHDMGGQLVFSPSYLLGRVVPGADLLGGMDRASLGFAMAFPDPREILLDGLSGRIGDLGDYFDAGLDRLLQQARFTFSYDIAPFGLDLVRNAGRVLMPRLGDHPEDPDTLEPWLNPDARTELPDRITLLGAALQGNTAGGSLADPLWDGRLNDLVVEDFAWPTADLYLDRDYFPHGGLLGAGHLRLPRLLVDAPPLELIATILNPDLPPLQRLPKVGELVGEYLTKAVEQGHLAFYVPAPNPPTFEVDGERLGPRGLLESILALDLTSVPLPELPGYRADLAFLQDEIDGSLLGVPLARARIELTPPGAAGETRLSIDAQVPDGSWIASLFDSASLDLAMSRPPASALGPRLQALAAAFAPDASAALDALFDTLTLADEESLTLPFLPGLDRDADGPTQTAQVQREQLAARREGVLNALRSATEPFAAPIRAGLDQNDEAAAAAALPWITDALVSALPRIRLEATVEGLHLPAPLDAWVQVSGDLKLTAYSPWYEPDAPGDDALARAKRGGGILLDAGLQLRAGLGTNGSALLDLAVPKSPMELLPTPGDLTDLAERLTQMPRLRLHAQQATLPVPQLGLTFHDMEIAIDSPPASDGDYVRLSGRLDALAIGKLRLEGEDGTGLGASLRVTPLPGQPLGGLDLTIDTALIRLPLLGAESILRLHGATPEAPATFSTHADWTFGITVESLALISPYDDADPPFLRLNSGADPQVTLSGQGLQSATLEIGLQPAEVQLFPNAEVLSPVSGIRAGFTLQAHSSGEIEGDLTLSPLQLGLLRLHGESGPDAALQATLRPYGLRMPYGFRATLIGLSTTHIRLRDCVVDGFGHFSVSSTRRTLPLHPWFHFSSDSLRVWHDAEGAGLVLTKPRVKLLPNTPLGRMAYLSLALPWLTIDSDGHFAVTLEDAILKAPGLPELSGRLEFGNTPLPGQPLAPYLRLENARIDWPPLPPLEASLEFNPEGFSASVVIGPLSLPGIELDPGSWLLSWTAGGSLQLACNALNATVLGLTARLASLRLTVIDGALSLEAELNADLVLLPDLLVIGTGSLNAGSGAGRLNCAIRAFHAPGGWLIKGNVQMEVEAGQVDIRLLDAGATELVDLPGLFTIGLSATSRLRLMPQGPTWQLALRGLAVSLLGAAHSLDSGVFDDDGRASLSWPTSAPALSLGPFSLELPSVVTLDLQLPPGDLLDSSLSVPSGATLHCDLSVWPVLGVDLGAALVLSANGAFSRDLAPFTFADIPLAADASITLSRDAGVVSLAIDSAHTLFGLIAGKLAASIADDGTLVASLSADFDLGSVPGIPPGLAFDFGAVVLELDAIDPLRPFSALAEANTPTGKAKARIRFGVAGVQACLLALDSQGNVSTDGDGNEITVVCFAVA